MHDARKARRTTEFNVKAEQTGAAPNEIGGRELKAGGTKNVVKDALEVKLKDRITGRNVPAVRARSIAVNQGQQGIPSKASSYYTRVSTATDSGGLNAGATPARVLWVKAAERLTTAAVKRIVDRETPNHNCHGKRVTRNRLPESLVVVRPVPPVPIVVDRCHGNLLQVHALVKSTGVCALAIS